MILAKQKYQALPPNERRAVWLIFVLTGGLLTLSATILDNVFSRAWWAVYASNAMPLVLGLLALASGLLVLNGHSRAGGYLFIGSLSTGMIVLTMVLQGAGFLLAAVTFVTCVYVGTLLFPQRFSLASLIFSLSVSAVILLADASVAWVRDPISPEDLWAAQLAAVVLLAIYAFSLLRQYKDFPLGTKMVFVSLALTIFPTLTIGLMSSIAARQALENNANQVLIASASQIAASFDSFVLYNLDNLRTEARMSKIAAYLETRPADRAGSAVEADVADYLSTLLERDTNFISSYALLDRDGMDVVDTEQGDAGLSKSDREYFLAARMSGQSFASPVRISPVTGLHSIYFSAPVYAASGEFLGVLRARYDARVLQQTIASSGQKDGEPVWALLVDENGIILGDSMRPEQVHKSILTLDDTRMARLQAAGVLSDRPVEELTAAMPFVASQLLGAENRSSISGEFHDPPNGSNSGVESHIEHAGVVKMSTMPWIVAAIQPQAVLFAPMERLSRGILMLGIVTTFIGVLFAILVSRSMAKPLLNLTGIVNRFALGDLTASAQVRAGDEIGVLASAFNAMADELRGLIYSLEQRVDDRTRALSASVEVSRRLSTILDQNQLVREVVAELQHAFNYYHVHIYLYDESGDNLVMTGGTGEAGLEMLVRGQSIPNGKGLVGRAAESGMLVLADDVYQAPGWIANSLLPDTRSELAVPIASAGTVLGVLDVQQNRPGALKQEDAVLVQAIANQLAVALQNARSYAEAQQRADREAINASRLAMVAEIATVVASIPTPDEMLQTVVNLVKSNFDLYHAHIYLLDAAGETLELARGAGDVGRRMVSEGRQISLSAEKSLVARAARARQGVIVNDVHKNAEFLSHPLLPETRSEMAVPMIAGDRLVGVLDVQDTRSGRFTDEEAYIMTTLAAQAAVALQNARSYVRAQREAEREALINTISERIQATDSVESALQVAVREVGRALGARRTTVRLGLERDGEEQ